MIDSYIHIILTYEDYDPDEMNDVVCLETSVKGIIWPDVLEDIGEEYQIQREANEDYSRMEAMEEALNNVCNKYVCAWRYVSTSTPTIFIP